MFSCSFLAPLFDNHSLAKERIVLLRRCGFISGRTHVTFGRRHDFLFLKLSCTLELPMSTSSVGYQLGRDRMAVDLPKRVSDVTWASDEDNLA